ncbi:hypothetical protein CXG81DRAFT_20492 [Caulochytrium protostelioides]|uniref:mRNA-capping enzyme subunit beta n=1 Tax=Caulochytrium protostelioides TaxID=1555241 RepID=A0A4P9X316_9FUNG|nr:hypothetical protein CXG81DRAFT_20492 [Caulochytrium protostelioides]|eukprot:RKO99403.1 hypothetical protein CXG81DRAFT_20492 [Caulochytrium protostelioides]
MEQHYDKKRRLEEYPDGAPRPDHHAANPQRYPPGEPLDYDQNPSGNNVADPMLPEHHRAIHPSYPDDHAHMGVQDPRSGGSLHLDHAQHMDSEGMHGHPCAVHQPPLPHHPPQAYDKEAYQQPVSFQAPLAMPPPGYSGAGEAAGYQDPAESEPEGQQSLLPPHELAFLVERSMFRCRSFDDLIRQLCHELANELITLPLENLEIEGKLGRLMVGNSRMHLACRSETLIGDIQSVRFESDIGLTHHRFLQEQLDIKCQENVLAFSESRTKDLIFHGPEGNQRVSLDAESEQPLPNGSIRKMKLKNWDIYRPNHAYDIRISINLELPVKPPSASQIPNLTRDKDRRSYTRHAFRVDLTRVQSVRHIFMLVLTARDHCCRAVR